MDKGRYSEIRKQLDFRPDNTKVWLSAVVTVLFYVLAVTVGSWLGQLLFAAATFRAFALFHDCVHGTFASKNWINVVAGHLLGGLCFLPFFAWRSDHRQHHLWTGNLEKDPVLRAVRSWRSSGRVPVIVRLGWVLWIPLASLVQHAVFWTYPLRTTGRDRLRALISVGAVALVWLALHFCGITVTEWWPGVVIYLLLTEVVNIPHHMMMPSTDGRAPAWEQYRFTRSVIYDRWMSWVVLDFNLHAEHHMFPDLPWYRLQCARRFLYDLDKKTEVDKTWALRLRMRDLKTVVLEQN